MLQLTETSILTSSHRWTTGNLRPDLLELQGQTRLQLKNKLQIRSEQRRNIQYLRSWLIWLQSCWVVCYVSELMFWLSQFLIFPIILNAWMWYKLRHIELSSGECLHSNVGQLLFNYMLKSYKKSSTSEKWVSSDWTKSSGLYWTFCLVVTLLISHVYLLT